MTEILLVLAICCAMVGGAIGSFLNVVIWRLPAGMSLVHPGSFCPKCKHPIRSFDNIPVFGWIFLRGRCRDCHAPISSRYPIIEAISVAVALGFFYAIAVHGWTPVPTSLLHWPEISQWQHNMAAHLTTQGEQGFNQFDLYLNQGQWYEHLIRISLVQTAIWSFFFYIMLTIGLIEYDQKKIPRSLITACGVMLCAVTIFSFFLWRQLVGDYETPQHMAEPIRRILFSLAAGSVAGIAGIPFVMKGQRIEWCAVVMLTAFCFGGIDLQHFQFGATFVLPVILACLLNLIAIKAFKRSFPGLFLFVTSAISVLLSCCHIL